MQRILVIQLRQLGDILLTSPCIRELRKAYPDAKIDFLAHKMGALVLGENPYLDELITYTEEDSVRKNLQLIARLRGKDYDLVLDFMYNPRSAFLAFMTGCKRRLAFPSRRKLAYTELVPRLKAPDYIVREKFAYLRYLGINPQDESLTLTWGEGHLGPYRAQKKELFPRDETFRVCLSPTHRREVRQWPKAAFAQLADQLVSQWGASVVWLWGPGEEAFVQEVQGMCQESTALAPKTSFRELAAFIGNCDLFIGNSNGPSHVAVSCQIPSLQLHGPTIARAWCPQTHRHQSIQKKAMAEISVEEVWRSLENLKSEIEKRVEARQLKGDRISWDVPAMTD